jgi:[ribosomal protein S5]-alanine N-acetyltransferase
MIETSRLTIIPLNYPQLELYMQGEGKLEKEFRLSITGRTVAPDIKERVTDLILPKVKAAIADEYLFYTFWIVIEKTSKIIVAELGFKGEPDKNGKIEIGYGTMYEQRKKGYMTEAVGGMIDWAKQRADVKYILAETDEKNLASIKVLKKNKFRFFDKKEKMKWWKILVK